MPIRRAQIPCPEGCKHHDRGMPTCDNLRLFSFLTAFTPRTDDEEADVQALDAYFKSIGEDPGWPVLPRVFIK